MLYHQSDDIIIEELKNLPDAELNYGESFPNLANLLYPKSLFYKTDVKKIYVVLPLEKCPNEFEECIVIRKGFYKWAETHYDSETKRRSITETFIFPDENTQVIGDEVTEFNDLFDFGNYFYFNYRPIEKYITFVKNVTEANEVKDILAHMKELCNMKFTFEERITENQFNFIYRYLQSMMRSVVFYKTIYK